jgi:hypothetical protein
MTAPKPGWYPDPAGAADLYRWWDGQDWTLAISESQQAPAPPAASSWAESEASAEGIPELVGGDPDSDSPRRRSAARTVVVVSLGFALFVSVGLGVGLIVWRDGTPGSRPGQPPSSSQASRSPTPSWSADAPSGQLDDATGIARIDQVSMQLPRMPYEMYTDPTELKGVFDVMFSADAVVHQRFNRRSNWYATVALVHLSPSMVISTDLDRTGSAAMQAIADHFFGAQPARLTDFASSDRAVDGHPGMLFTARAHYSVAKLGSRYDEVTVLLVRLDNGSMIAGLSSVPDDADPGVKALAAHSLESLTVS